MNTLTAHTKCSSPIISPYFAISTWGDVCREKGEGGKQRWVLCQQFPLALMGITPIKTQVTDAFLYSLGNFQHCILLVSALCPIISDAVFRAFQKASLCAGCHLQVNSTVMNLGISISPIIGWYQSVQSSSGKKNEENTLQKTSWFKYFLKIQIFHYDFSLPAKC